MPTSIDLIHRAIEPEALALFEAEEGRKSLEAALDEMCFVAWLMVELQRRIEEQGQ